jgi:hypothetical protein
VAKYQVEAYKWDLLAAAQGDTKAKRNATALELMMTPGQVAEGSGGRRIGLHSARSHPPPTDNSMRTTSWLASLFGKSMNLPTEQEINPEGDQYDGQTSAVSHK